MSLGGGYEMMNRSPYFAVLLFAAFVLNDSKGEPNAPGSEDCCKPTLTGTTPVARAGKSPQTAESSATKGWPAKPWPEGMVWIPGGEFWMGSDEPQFTDARPWHRVYVDGFWMDATGLTNEKFETFVRATGYVTLAERAPAPRQFPNIPKIHVAGSVVFTSPNEPVSLDNSSQWWNYVPGANWRHPSGPNSDLKGKDQHPVVQVAYEDAIAFCKWAGKRLPSEAEFEFAARGGLDRKAYAWGDDFRPQGRFMANTFQGHFPDKDTAEDGFAGTAPVASFPPNDYGLYDIAGNVWEWCSDWYRSDYYKTLAEAGGVARNPSGPADSFDSAEPETQKRVHKGGSFLCTDQYCKRYMPGGRGKGDPGTATNHLGFRGVMTPAMWEARRAAILKPSP